MSSVGEVVSPSRRHSSHASQECLVPISRFHTREAEVVVSIGSIEDSVGLMEGQKRALSADSARAGLGRQCVERPTEHCVVPWVHWEYSNALSSARH
jgi:hypothetical protein